MAIYDRWGFDEDGFNREGFNKMGFDRDGYNKQGYDIHGYDRQGFDKNGYDKDGYDAQGYDAQGFDRNGLDRDGYDKNGRDIKGFNREGFDALGYDRDGYDREGYDRDGYDRKGYGRKGYDREGYDQQGFNENGYDREGYDRNGFDLQGYDRDGFNREGYDREGYDRAGFDVKGYDRDGFDIWGFDCRGYDADGFDFRGYDAEGYNILGYDVDGFDRSGIHRDGFAKSDFDQDGYHLLTGFNLQGYDRDGFNINGFDAEGYDREGYDIEGYNKAGYNRAGFNRRGFDRKGYDIKGFNADGYDKYGYDSKGFNKKGFDREGYDRSGYDAEGFDRYGYDRDGKEKKRSIYDLKAGMTVYHKTLGEGKIVRFERERFSQYIVLHFYDFGEKTFEFPRSFRTLLSIEKPEQLKQREKSFSEEEDKAEKKWYSSVTRYLRGDYLHSVTAEAERDFSPQVLRYIDRNGMLSSKEVGPGIDKVRERVKVSIDRLVADPYFAHISYKETPYLYIGKKEIPGYVTDWADKKASLYYQYQVYIGNEQISLKLVREIDFGSGRYLGYRDLYNMVLGQMGEESNIADERLSRIIMSNQKDKKIHDIIKTIQRKQYEIITQTPDHNLLVLGCAGSGKTMILMHKIRFMKYNNADFDMQKVMVISPTDILGRESKELSRILDVESVKQFTMNSFYRDIIAELINDFYKQENNLLNKIDTTTDCIDLSYFQQEYLDEIYYRVLQYLDLKSEKSIKYCKDKSKELGDAKKIYYDLYGNYSKFSHLNSIFSKAKQCFEKYHENGIKQIIRLCEQSGGEKEKVYYDIKFARLVRSLVQLKKETKLVEQKDTNDTKDTWDISDPMYYTKSFLQSIDVDDLYRFLKKNHMDCMSVHRFTQLLCVFKKIDCDIEEDAVKRVRRELEGLTDKGIDAYIQKCEQRYSLLEKLTRTLEVLRYLLSSGYVSKQDRPLDINEVDLSSGDSIREFFDEISWKQGDPDPLSDFYAYERLQDKSQRLKKFEKGIDKWCYLQDMLFDELQISNDEGEYRLNDSKLFAFCYLLQRIAGSHNNGRYHIFIDEFQDFSNIEIQFLTEYYPRSVFNLFGDYLQCINPKGIHSEGDFQMNGLFKNMYRITENYRNAKDITNYVKQKFGIDMQGIGLPGTVECTDKIKLRRLDKGDRAAIIIADGSDLNIESDVIRVFDFKEKRAIVRNAYNIIPVSMVKGLEFEKVIVVTNMMTDNQKYVACTRAIKYLQVVEYINS